MEVCDRLFALSPVDAETFRLAKEQWHIWRRWGRAFAAGEVSESFHPGVGGQDERYDATESKLKARYSLLVPVDRRFRVVFRTAEVEWR